MAEAKALLRPTQIQETEELAGLLGRDFRQSKTLNVT